MVFIATLVALIIERFFHWSHLRQWGWFIQLQRFLIFRFGRWPKFLLLLVSVLLPVIAVGIVSCLLMGWGYSIPQLIFNILVLVYCLGSSNLWVEIYACIRALNKEATPVAVEQVKAAFNLNVADQPQAFHQAFTRAIFIAANQRIFAVVFWFVILGPVGAVLYRTISLCAQNSVWGLAEIAQKIQRCLDWVPARLFTFIFALCGNFTKVFICWRRHLTAGISANDILLGDCGLAALDVVKMENIPEDGTAENEALTLLDRALVMALVILAIAVLVI